MKPVTGMDSRASEVVVKKYDKEFEKASQVPTYSMSIGGLGTAVTSTTGGGGY